MLVQLTRKTVKTRKPHNCFACQRDFPPGTYMLFQTNKNDSLIYSLYSCDTCESIMFEFNEHTGGYEESCVLDLLIYSDELERTSTPEELLAALRQGREPEDVFV